MKYKNKYDNIIKELCKLYGIKKFTDMNIKEHKNAYKIMSGVKEWHINSSTLCGNDEIIFGFYKNPHLKLISALHEIGHAITTQSEIDNILKNFENESKDRNTFWVIEYQCEKLAWKKAFELAKKHDIVILKSSYIWAEKQLQTYKKD